MSNKTSGRNKILVGCLCAFGCETIFGLSYIFTKQATAIASSFALLGWRFVIAFLIMSLCILTGLIKINLKGKKLALVLTVAIFNPLIYFIGETVGINYTTASESGSFLACIPIMSLFASTLILHEKPIKYQVIGICITLAGMLVTVSSVGMEASFSPIGYMILFIAVVSYALYSVFVEKASDFTGAEITYIMIAAGAVVFVILAIGEGMLKDNLEALFFLPLTNRNFLVTVLYQGIGSSVLAFFMSNVAIANIGVNRTASFIGVATVVSIIAGVVILKENFSMLQLIGVVFIIAGVYTANIRQKTT